MPVGVQDRGPAAVGALRDAHEPPLEVLEEDASLVRALGEQERRQGPLHAGAVLGPGDRGHEHLDVDVEVGLVGVHYFQIAHRRLGSGRTPGHVGQHDGGAGGAVMNTIVELEPLLGVVLAEEVEALVYHDVL